MVREGEQPSAIAVVDTKLVKADVREVLLLTRVRQELIRQEEHVKDRDHLRSMEALPVKSKVLLSAVAILTGTGLAVAGFSLPGFLALGAGLYWLAPSFIDQVAKRVTGAQINDE